MRLATVMKIWPNTARSLCARMDSSPCIDRGQNVIVLCDQGGGYSTSGQSYTLNTIERHSVCYAVDCRNGELNREKSATLQAKGQGGWSVNVTNPVLMENET